MQLTVQVYPSRLYISERNSLRKYQREAQKIMDLRYVKWSLKCPDLNENLKASKSFLKPK